MSQLGRGLLLTLVFLAVGFAVLTGYRAWTAQSGEHSATPPLVVGQQLPASAVVTPLVGADAYPLSDEIVGVTVINYFGSWCRPCRSENPALLELRTGGVRVIGVAVRDEPNAIRQFLDELGDPFFRVLMDNEGASMQALGMGAEIPQTLVVSASGEVLQHHSGPLVGTDGEAALEEIRELAGPR